MESSVPKGIIRLNVQKADFRGVGGVFHSMHCMVSITVKKEGATPWKSGKAEKAGHECEWKDKHCDIPSSDAGLQMHIGGYDLTKDHDAIKANLIGEADIGVGTFLVPAKHDIEVFYTDKHGHHKSAGHITVTSEYIPIPAQ